jgi:hypothetical protein
MMKEFIQSFIPFALPAFRAALRFAGPLRAFAKMSAKGFPLGTISPAAVLLTATANEQPRSPGAVFPGQKGGAGQW